MFKHVIESPLHYYHLNMCVYALPFQTIVLLRSAKSYPSDEIIIMRFHLSKPFAKDTHFLRYIHSSNKPKSNPSLDFLNIHA